VATSAEPPTVAGIGISHPDRVLFVPDLIDRPLTLVHCASQISTQFRENRSPSSMTGWA
jgi:hypothetical protein